MRLEFSSLKQMFKESERGTDLLNIQKDHVNT